jgi:outer membrane protein TolC
MSKAPITSFLPCITVLFLWTACDPAHQVEKADRDVAALLGQRANDDLWRQAALEPMPAEGSRLTDFANVEDDSASLKILHEIAGQKLPADWYMPKGNGDIKWLDALPRDQTGAVVIDLDSAVEVGIRNSRDFQQRKEALYLSALDVTEERFLFRPRLFLGGGLDAESRGSKLSNPGEDSSGTLDSQLRLGLASGGELLLNLANTFLWDLSGGGGETPSGLLSFRFIQPLLQKGGRAWALEDLARAERSFLADMRLMHQYQQSFYVEIVTGRRLSVGPSRGTGGSSGIGSKGGSGGFLGLLQERQQIRNLEANVARLRDSHAQLEAAFDAGRINNRLQVDQARQALFNAQSRLLQERARQESELDNFKMQLGLPPDLDLKLDDPVLDRFDLVRPAVTRIQDQIGNILNAVRAPENVGDSSVLAENLSKLLGIEESTSVELEFLSAKLKAFEETLPIRKAQLKGLHSRPELQVAGLDPQLFSGEHLIDSQERLSRNHARLQEAFTKTWLGLRELKNSLAAKEKNATRQDFLKLTTTLSGLLLELSLDQAASQLESVTMVNVDLPAGGALEIARENRMDWMNKRADLHDAWRRTGLYRNALKSSLDLVVAGDFDAEDDKPLRFQRNRGTFRGGIRLDTPMTRHLERNAYREALIRFNRARREYVEYEDGVKLELRDTLRTIRLEQLNFELKRAAVRVAIAQVDLARLRLNQPPQPGKVGQFGATTARDLVSALSDLLEAQNEFLDGWVGYEILRMMLDFQLGTMRVDDSNLWVDPGEVVDQ